MTTPAVSLDRLVKRFGDFTAVDGISLDVPAGEIFGFLGPNGAGKSTTIRMLCGLLLPSGGSGTVAGFDINRESEKIKEHIGYMSQKFSLYDDLTVEENIDFFGGIYRIPGARLKERKSWALDMAELTDLRRAVTGTLPGGVKQRLSLGCAVLHEPPILFLDEPTSGVDPISRRKFWNLIYQLSAGGSTVFVTTHYMEEAEYCDRLGLIYRGALIALGTPSQLKHGLISDRIVEVKCGEPQLVLDQLGALPGVSDVALFGQGLHLTTAEPEALMARLERTFAELKINGASWEEVEPSLEDVFVSLIESHEKSASPRGEFKS
ncbi:MAG TPA: ABC transporter ATP-binding protein [Acidobacteriota bacterium]|nr:ABC transporter ATP-binding protein [Acidobacteriota bacterium]HNT16929.1 ABC transporter ATP-binding protein [Acidobacteriota bacterium]